MKEMITVEKEVYEAVLRNSVRVSDLEAENQQLKELLRDCRGPINYALCLNLSEEEKIEFKNLLAKIKQAIGEK